MTVLEAARRAPARAVSGFVGLRAAWSRWRPGRARLGGDVLNRLGLATLLDAPCVARLGGVRFIGVLGASSPAARQSRLEHSLGVAYLATRVAERATLPEPVVRHVAAAALLHDICQWPLSHTCEGAFRRITGLGNGALVRAMLFDEGVVPAAYHLGERLEAQDLDRQQLWSLLDKSAALGERTDPWTAAAHLLRSAISPDTLDGIARAAAVFGVVCPDPARVAEKFVWSAGLAVQADALGLIDAFWRAKGTVYDDHIHAPAALELEARYDLAVEREFRGADTAALLALTDEDVLAVLRGQLRPLTPDDLAAARRLRFRAPRRYFVAPEVTWPGPSVPAEELRRRYRSVSVDGQ